MKKSLLGWLAALALVSSACTVSATGTSGGSADGEGGGLPVAVDGADARDQLYQSLDGKKVAYIPMSLQFDLTKMWGQQFEALFASMGADYVQEDAANNVDTQIRMIDSHINDGVDVIIVQNPDVGVLSTQVQRAHQEGIYVISVNVQGSQSSDAYVGANYTAMGEMLAERMVADCKAKGRTKVAIVGGFGTDSNDIEADKGWLPVFEKAGIEVVSDQQSNYDPTKANQIATAVLQQHKDLCGFAVIFDVTALGVAQAVESAGVQEKVGIYNFDASAVWCDALRDGRVTAGVAYNASGIAVAAAYQAQALLLAKPAAGSQRVMGYVPHMIVDRSNVATAPGACYGVS